MEFIIKQDVFSKALTDVGKAVSSRTLLPILSGIKIIAEKDGITLIGSDTDIIIERMISLVYEGREAVEILKTGSVVVSGKHFTELIKKLPGDIHVQAKENHIVKIQAGEINTQFNGFQADEYPSLPRLEMDSSILIPSDSLKEAMRRTAFATANSETRPVLTGVNFKFSNNRLISVATDSQRLALSEITINSEIDGSFVVPGTSINELLKLINHYSGEVEIKTAEGYILFKTNEVTLYSRLIAGNYPDTSSLIPAEHKTALILCRESLLKGIDRACLFAGEWKNNNVTLSLDQQKLRITSSSSGLGNIEETLDMKSLEGETELKISVDGHFMLDALKTIKDTEIKLMFSGTMKPIVIESAAEESAYLHLISPVRSY